MRRRSPSCPADSTGDSPARPSLPAGRPGWCPLREAAARRGRGAGRQPEAADHRHGLQRSARGPRPLDGAPGGRRSREAKTGSASGKGNHPDSAAPPRPQAVAGKKCGAWPNSMKSTSPRWRMFWRRMNGPTIRSNPSSAWTRSRSRCTPMSALPLRPQPGREARRDNEYERCGTANVFCAVEPKAGRHFTFPTPDRSGFRVRSGCLSSWRLQYPEAKTIHLVMDNLNIHRRKSLTDVSATRWRRGLGPLHRSLHAHSRKLAQSGGNRNRHLLPAMSR